MTPENPLALDVATRTTRGRACHVVAEKSSPQIELSIRAAATRTQYSRSGNASVVI